MPAEPGVDIAGAAVTDAPAADALSLFPAGAGAGAPPAQKLEMSPMVAVPVLRSSTGAAKSTMSLNCDARFSCSMARSSSSPTRVRCSASSSPSFSAASMAAFAAARRSAHASISLRRFAMSCCCFATSLSTTARSSCALASADRACRASCCSLRTCCSSSWFGCERASSCRRSRSRWRWSAPWRDLLLSECSVDVADWHCCMIFSRSAVSACSTVLRFFSNSLRFFADSGGSAEVGVSCAGLTDFSLSSFSGFSASLPFGLPTSVGSPRSTAARCALVMPGLSLGGSILVPALGFSTAAGLVG
mmetsp:Transcript_49545/g.152925  ORF Transcript_49545/g.152925 Transcript_49545/m.152925 type:complete len:304 (-) Transcript_49545:1222-2133(-)